MDYYVKGQNQYNNNKGYYGNHGWKQGNKSHYYKVKKETDTNQQVDSIYTIPPEKKKYNKEEKIDPYTAQVLLYRAEMYILLRYPHLIDINANNEDSIKNIDENSFFYVIKCFSEEDLHKAIKYNVWTSTKTGNKTLSNSFKIARENNGSVYFFFSCNGSGRFVGVAKMKTDVDMCKYFPFWTQDNKWGGLFDIEWLFIKDVPFSKFKHIIITLKDGERKSVINSRDTQEIPFQESKSMLDIVKQFNHVNTLLEHFEYYDLRQENYEKDNPQISQLLNK